MADFSIETGTPETIEELEAKIGAKRNSIRRMPDFAEPQELYKELINSIRKYHPSTDITQVEKAYQIANAAHKDQKRKSGEAYIIHPLCVSVILAELELDKETIVAGLLHDVVEDTVMTDEEISREFGAEVALLVDGVTKLGQLSYDADKVEVQAENLRKMFLAMAKDIRVILIKLADRLHNMRTLQYMRPEKQKEIARETMDIYSPIAHRLGISKIKIELDDLCLKYLEAQAYYDLIQQVAQRKTAQDDYIRNLTDEVRGHIERAGIHAEIGGRAKHFFSIYKKMVNQNKTLDQIYDLFAIRIIVRNVMDCYAALGVIHENYVPVPGRFKDYIAMPKPNRYQSLHTTLLGSDGQPFEIQIRTVEMHRIAEYGIAAHWKYKESATVINAVEAHHGDVEPETLIACVVQAADTISAARPGARRETLETYTNRLKQLEDITNQFKGVDKSFAIQAGREIRVMVVPEQVSDADMILMARDIAKQIEYELEYPGQIKVNGIRESRVTDYAK